MDRRLLDVSQSGNMNALHALLEDEPKILDHIEAIPDARTPLQIAIIAGNSNFAREIAIMKPSFMTKFDSFGYTPIHLASERGQTEVIKYFIEINPSTMFIKDSGQEKRTALHCAVIGGQVGVIDLLVGFNPCCVMELTGRNESVFHLAVKNEQAGSFMVLVGWLHELVKCDWNKVGNYEFGRKIENILNWKDDDGNTVHHLATVTKQHQMMAALLNCKSLESRNRMEPNTLNCNCDLRAFDIQLEQRPREKQDHARSTKEILYQTGSSMGSNQTISLNIPHLDPKILPDHRIDLFHGTHPRADAKFGWSSSSAATAGRIIGLLAMLFLGLTCFIAGGTKLPQTNSYYLLYAFTVVSVIGLFLSLVIHVDQQFVKRDACLGN